jgi:hypothetical protein
MRFEITPEEAQRPAAVIIDYLKAQGLTVMVEKAVWRSAPYRTTLAARKCGRHVLVEAQGTVSYGRSLRDLVSWLATNRQYAEIYLATTTEATVQAGVLREMKVDGVGLFVVEDNGVVTEQQPARNYALVVTPDPTLALGAYKSQIEQAVRKFNEINRKDGLRDMVEIVEQLTENVGVAACRKGRLKVPETAFKAKDWAGQINDLANSEAYIHPHKSAINTSLKNDLHSFRGCRNLISHKVRSLRENANLQKQFAERMMQGPRLAADLISIQRKIK